MVYVVKTSYELNIIKEKLKELDAVLFEACKHIKKIEQDLEYLKHELRI